MTKLDCQVWSGFLWGMALLGLLLLPSDYRAGAEIAHAHALLHLWVDAADGSIHHHPAGADHRSAAPASWFDPAVESGQSATQPGMATTEPDVAEHHDSAPVPSGVHFLIAAITTVVIVAGVRAPLVVAGRRLESRAPRIVLPPPRWTSAAA